MTEFKPRTFITKPSAGGHPITPPQELIAKWASSICGYYEAARWGADQELEACIEYFHEYDASWGEHSDLVTGLRAARRPKPLSLKEQSLALIGKIQGNKEMWQIDDLDIVRRALEALPEDES